MLKRKPAWVRGNISPHDQPLLIGLTTLLRPKKIVEIGVASGWSGCLFLDALIENRQPAEYIGIDFSKHFYLDKSRPTGAAIGALFPKPPAGHRLLLGAVAVDVLREIGTGVDAAFIDGDHLHPWASLDLLTLLPSLAPSAYVLLHDINLSTVERHQHKNRGPKYLFDGWPLDKMHSSQQPPMIGAIQMPAKVDDSILRFLLDTLYSPWETAVDPSVLAKIAGAISQAYGNGWGGQFAAAFANRNLQEQIGPAADADGQGLIKACIAVSRAFPDANESKDLLSQACKYFPADTSLSHYLSVALYREKKIDAALAVSKKCVELDPGNASHVSFLGQLLYETGCPVEAEGALRQAISIDGRPAVFHYRLGKLLLETGRDVEAASTLKKAADLYPHHAGIRSLVQQAGKH